MIALAIMVMVCAILGTSAMGMMFNVEEVMANQDAYISNGAYWAFEKLGAYYGIGDSLKIIYSICNAIGQFSTLVLSIDAPLRMLLDNEQAREFIPKGLLKKNKSDAYINGIWMVVILSGSIIVDQALGDSAAGLLKQPPHLHRPLPPNRPVRPRNRWLFGNSFACSAPRVGRLHSLRQAGE